MSDASPGPGWWLANDGRWYPPQAISSPPPPVAPVPQGKPLHRRVWFWVLLVALLFIGGCSAIVISAGTSVDHQAHVKHTVIYSVTGTDSGTDVTYQTASGMSQQSSVPLPWSATVTFTGFDDFADLTATVGSNNGTVRCTITEDGKVVATNTASGAFASANCSAG